MIQTLMLGFGACGLGNGRRCPGLGGGGGCKPLPDLLLLLSLLIEVKETGLPFSCAWLLMLAMGQRVSSHFLGRLPSGS